MAYTAQQLVQMGYGGYAGWGDAEANADFNATGGSGKKTSSSSSSSSSSGSSSSSSGSIQANYDAELQKAYERLKPYYQKMLDYAGGDLNLAKRMIQADYDSGKRENQEEAEIKRRGLALQKQGIQTNYDLTTDEARGAYQQAVQEQNLLFPQEQEQMSTGLNRRGVSQGGLADTEASRLKTSQSIRKEAIDRALQERELSATKTKEQGTAETGLAEESNAQKLARAMGTLEQNKGFKTEQAQTDFEKQRQALSKSQEQEAAGLASNAYNQNLNLQQTQEQKKLADQQSKIAQEQWEWQKKYYS